MDEGKYTEKREFVSETKLDSWCSDIFFGLF